MLFLSLEGLQRAGFTIPQIGVGAAICLFSVLSSLNACLIIRRSFVFQMGLLGACYRPVASPKGKKKVPPLVYLARSLIAAASIGFGMTLP